MTGEWYLGEIKMVAWHQGPPKHWVLCEGQTLQVKDNDALYSLIGNDYGGELKKTFKLPDLRTIPDKGWDKTKPIYIIAVEWAIYPTLLY